MKYFLPIFKRHIGKQTKRIIVSNLEHKFLIEVNVHKRVIAQLRRLCNIIIVKSCK